MEGSESASVPPSHDHYLLEIRLCPLTLTQKKKKVIRELSVPASINFSQLHEGIFEAFQHWEHHLFEFSIYNCDVWTKTTRNKAMREGALLKILDEPYNLGFGPPERVASKVCVKDIFESKRYKGKVIGYVWDGWDHVVVVKGQVRGPGFMELLSGVGKPPAEEAPWPWPVYPFLDEDKEEVNRHLRELVFGGGESGDKEDVDEDDEDQEEDEEEDGEDGEDEEDEEDEESDEASVSEEGNEDPDDLADGRKRGFSDSRVHDDRAAKKARHA